MNTDCYYRVDFKFSKPLFKDPELICCDEIEGAIQCVDMDDSETLIGTVELAIFKLDLAEYHQIHPYDLLDSNSEETENLYNTLFNNDTLSFKDHLEDAYFPDFSRSRILHIKKLEFLPKYRGCGIGRKIVNVILETFLNETTIVTTKPFPLQWGGNYSDNDALKKKDKDKVIEFWQSEGFKRIDESDFYILPS